MTEDCYLGKQWFVHCFSSFDRWPAMIEMDPDTEYYFQLENPESMFPVSLWIVLILEKINDFTILWVLRLRDFVKNSNVILFYYVNLHPWMFYSIFKKKFCVTPLLGWSSKTAWILTRKNIYMHWCNVYSEHIRAGRSI